jgi:hypothetical protein
MKKIILLFLCIATANFAMSERQKEKIASIKNLTRDCRCLVCAKQNDNEDTYIKDTCSGQGWQKEKDFSCFESSNTNVC